MSVVIDICVRNLDVGHGVVAIKRSGETEYLGRHLPWFGLYVKRGLERRVAETLLRSNLGIVEVEVMEDRIPYLMMPGSYRYQPVLDYVVLKVMSVSRDLVRSQAETVLRMLRDLNVYAGVYNIVYPVRASFDLDIKFFHGKCPLIFQPNSELEGYVRDLIAGVGDLKIMAFDIEVYNEGGRFPRPGDPLISIAYGIVRLDDESFYDPSWYRDNVVVIEAPPTSSKLKLASYAREIVTEFLKVIDREKPDVIVGYNSVDFDVRYMRPFLDSPSLVFPDPHHFEIGGRIYPHVDLYEVRTSMGSSLGIRSGRAYALDAVAKEIARNDRRLGWLFGSPLLEAEEKMNHAKLVFEWMNGTQLFENYTRADVYLTLILAKAWMLTLALLSALVQIPITELARLNTGQIAEYNAVHWLEYLGFEPMLLERAKEFRKTEGFSGFEELLEEWTRKLFSSGKVYVKRYGMFGPIVEGDFAQLYPTLMANEALDPAAVRVWRHASVSNPFKVTTYADPLFEGLEKGAPRYRVSEKLFPIAMGRVERRSSSTMILEDVIYALSTYGPISFLMYKMFNMRRITKKLKKEAKELNRPELAAPDQAVKILNNATYGGFSKRRGWINPVLSAYIFWKTLKILYDVIEYAERELGLEVMYGDTDSVFVKCRVDEARKLYPSEESETKACEKWFREAILPKLNEFVKRRYGVEFEIEFEDAFDYCIYPKTKRGHEASRKSYICVKDGKVVVFKGDFYKTMAPEAIRERLAEFYEEIIRRRCRTPEEVERIMREFLERAPLHKLFVKKTVDSFLPDERRQGRRESDVKYVQRIKNLNRNFHFAALHLAYAWKYPGVRIVSSVRKGENAWIVTYYVDAKEVLSTGSLIPMFLPTGTRSFVLYIDDDGRRVRVHKVKVRSCTKVAQREGDAVRETGYRVTVVYIDEWISRSELIDLAIKSMRKYIIDDIAKKLLPALHVGEPSGPLDRYIDSLSKPYPRSS